MAELRPAPFPNLLRRMFDELETCGSIFDLPQKKFWRPDPERDLGVLFRGAPAGTPVGPAAGPHTQLAQNIVLAWLGGARILELKTVQKNDRLTIPRPCIDAATVGYNVEWSQELRLHESLSEYISAWVLIHLLQARNVLGLTGPQASKQNATLFDLSVGYDLAGLKSPEMVRFIEGLKAAGPAIASLRSQMGAECADVPIPGTICDSVTLSTFHGCPAGEIEDICLFMLQELDLDVVIKLNPTLLGHKQVVQTLSDELGYSDIDVPEAAFENDIDFASAAQLVERLRRVARRCGRVLGIKLTNTLVVRNHKRFFPESVQEMYLSGQPLHVLAMRLVHKWRRHFGADLPISFSAGIDARNFAAAVACDLLPVTSCTDLLRPGGYGRLSQYLKRLERRMKQLRVGCIDDYLICAEEHASEALQRALAHTLEAPQARALEAPLREGLRTTLAAEGARDLRAWLAQALLQHGPAGQLASSPGLVQQLHARWAREAGVANSASIIARLAGDPRYAAAANSKPPKTTDAQLDLFDCINCDKCIPVCPNDANFTFSVAEAPAVSGVVVWEAPGFRLAAAAGTVIAKRQQIGNFAEFCNECGNCDVFCPEVGEPYLLKPRFFASQEALTEDVREQGFLVADGPAEARIEGRLDGRALELVVDRATQTATYSDALLSTTLSWPAGEVLSASPRGDSAPARGHGLSLDGFHILRSLLQGVLTTPRSHHVRFAEPVGEDSTDVPD